MLELIDRDRIAAHARCSRGRLPRRPSPRRRCSRLARDSDALSTLPMAEPDSPRSSRARRGAAPRLVGIAAAVAVLACRARLGVAARWLAAQRRCRGRVARVEPPPAIADDARAAGAAAASAPRCRASAEHARDRPRRGSRRRRRDGHACSQRMATATAWRCAGSRRRRPHADAAIGGTPLRRRSAAARWRRRAAPRRRARCAYEQRRGPRRALPGDRQRASHGERHRRALAALPPDPARRRDGDAGRTRAGLRGARCDRARPARHSCAPPPPCVDRRVDAVSRAWRAGCDRARRGTARSSGAAGSGRRGSRGPSSSCRTRRSRRTPSRASSANFTTSGVSSNWPRYLRPCVHAKIDAIGFVDVGLPFWCSR